MRAVELETLMWIDCYNNRRLLGTIGSFPLAKAEEASYANLNSLDVVAWSLNNPPSVKRGAGQAAEPLVHAVPFSEFVRQLTVAHCGATGLIPMGDAPRCG